MMMDGEYVSRREHEEFVKRMEEANGALMQRIVQVEKQTQQITSLAVSVERLATNMEQLAKDQKVQNEKLDKLESKDGEMWRKVVGYVITAVLGILVGFVFKQVGM